MGVPCARAMTEAEVKGIWELSVVIGRAREQLEMGFLCFDFCNQNDLWRDSIVAKDFADGLG